MRKYQRGSLERVQFDERSQQGRSGSYSVSELFAFGVAGLALAGTLAVSGHYFGQQANARTVVPQSKWADVVSPASTIVRKASLLHEPTTADFKINLAAYQPQVSTGLKADFVVATSIIEPQEKLARLDRMIATPTVLQLERNWKVGVERKKRIMAQRKQRLAGRSCLARAIYFEARSESELGQLAVAKVIMNRVKNSAYPSSICDVVYQGAHRKNACQFSFACDGSADNPRAGKAWNQAKRVAGRALNGTSDVQIISTATNYHADYVKPRWASTMKRLIKIGKHIFYHDS